jgi:DNA-binding MarR family transcriptional regulator
MNDMTSAKSPYEVRILRDIRRIIRAVSIHSKMLKSTQDITTPQLVTLVALCNEGPMSLKALAKAIDLSPSTVVGIIDRLEAKCMVQRSRDAGDRRQIQISITAQGLAFVEQSPNPLQTRLANELSKLPELEQATIALSLERLVQLFGADRIDASAILAIDAMDTGVKDDHAKSHTAPPS